MNIVALGYLENSYLDGYPYLSGQIQAGCGFQVEMLRQINDATGSQTNQKIVVPDFDIGMQVELFPAGSDHNGQQVTMRIIDDLDDPHVGMQSQMLITEEQPSLGSQVTARIFKEVETGQQALMHIVGNPAAQSTQVSMLLKPQVGTGMEAKLFPLRHWQCPLYLNVHPYLTTSYLADCMRAFQGMQVSTFIKKEVPIGSQVTQHIIDTADDPHIGMQTRMRIYREDEIGMQTRMNIVSPADDIYLGQQVSMVIKDHLEKTGLQVRMRIVDKLSPIGMQTNRLAARKNSFQATMVIYNITQLRILYNFASRGTPALGGNNWTSMQTLKTGDYTANNLNTDVIEQRCQTATLPAIWELRCDTGIAQGAFVDTIAILSHNITRSGRVTVQATNDPTWGTVSQSIVMTTELSNMYYISPTLPSLSFRYWRFLVEDITNPDDYLRIGVIVFGSSNIFTLRECFTNPVIYGQKHFKDTIETEGYTNISNDRATRKFLTLEFENLKYDGGNFTLLRNYLNYAQTDLKCLIIPRPTRPSALAVFSKLNELPQESHNAIADDSHFVSLQLNWDEAL